MLVRYMYFYGRMRYGSKGCSIKKLIGPFYRIRQSVCNYAFFFRLQNKDIQDENSQPFLSVRGVLLKCVVFV